LERLKIVPVTNDTINAKNLLRVYPCPCGYYATRPCICSNATVTKYQKRISGPLLDRIDIHIQVPRVDYDNRPRMNEN
jgi:predicted ATPase with chaperone activity